MRVAACLTSGKKGSAFWGTYCQFRLSVFHCRFLISVKEI